MNSNEYLIVTDPCDSGGVSVDNCIHQIPYRVSIYTHYIPKFIRQYVTSKCHVERDVLKFSGDMVVNDVHNS